MKSNSNANTHYVNAKMHNYFNLEGFMMKICSIFMLLLVLAGCAGMDNAMLGYGRYTEKVEEFDGSTRLEVAPARLSGASVLLGARWNTRVPDYVTLVLAYDHGEYGGYTNVRSLAVNVAGQITRHEARSISNIDRNLNIFTGTTKSKSVNEIVVPFELLGQMLSGTDVKLRVDTSEGFEDSTFSKDGALNGAKPALKKLYDRAVELSVKA